MGIDENIVLALMIGACVGLVICGWKLNDSFRAYKLTQREDDT